MVGRTVSHFTILDKLGEGGMGVVYRAEDKKLGRTVALKFLSLAALTSHEDKARFVQEARAAASLDHPNICTVHEIDEQDGLAFLAMAYVDGVNLRQRIDEGPLSIDQALDYAIQIGEGLQAAHDKGIVHRDIKAANLMINQRGRIKIMDFGLAKLMGTKDEPGGKTTAGTVAYMSPEQTRGDDVDERSDIWSLGVVMYEMLTGLRPFRGDYEQSVIYAIINREPRSVSAMRHDVPEKFERVLSRALRKRRDERYASVAELLQDLKQLKAEIDSREMLAHWSNGILPVRHWRFPRFAMPTAIVGLLGVALLGLYLGSGQREAEGSHVPIAVADITNETGDGDLNGLSGMLITSLEQSRRLSVYTRATLFDVLERLGKEGVDRIDEPLGREICTEAGIRVLIVPSIRRFDDLYTLDLKAYEIGSPGHLFTAKEEGRGRASIPDMIDRIAKKTREGLHERAAEIQRTSVSVAHVTTPNLEAYQQYFIGEQAIQRLDYKLAQKAFTRAIGLDSTFALAHYRLAYANWWGGESHEIQRAQLDKALALRDRLPERFRMLLTAQNAVNEEGFEDGIALLKEMEVIYPDDKEMIYNIGDYSYHAGLHEEAARYLERSLDMDPLSERALNHLTLTYLAMGEYERAVAVGQRYLEVAESVEAHIVLSNAFLQAGDTAGAMEVMTDAMAKSPDSPWVRHQIATVRCMQDDFEYARAVLDSLAHHELSEPSGKRLRYASLRGLMGANLYTGRYREAITNLDELIALSREHGDTTSVVFHRQTKGFLYMWGWDDRSRAQAEFDEARTLFESIDSEHMAAYWSNAYWGNVVSFFFLTGKPEIARAIAERELRDDPKRFRSARFFTHWRDGDYAGARAVADTVMSKNKEEASLILYYLAQSQMDSGHYDQAMLSLQRLQQNMHYAGPRPIFYVPSYYLMGRTFEKKGDAVAAMRSYEKFLEMWSHADEDLSLLSEAALRLADLKTVTQ